MTTPIEQHLADFLISQEKLGLGAYCRRCLIFWREAYVPEIAEKVEALLKAHYRNGK